VAGAIRRPGNRKREASDPILRDTGDSFREFVLIAFTAGRRITHGPFGLAVSGRGGWHLPHPRSMPHPNY